MKYFVILFICVVALKCCGQSPIVSVKDTNGNTAEQEIVFTSEQEVIKYYDLVIDGTHTNTKGVVLKRYRTKRGSYCIIKKNSKGNFVKSSIPKVQTQ